MRAASSTVHAPHTSPRAPFGTLLGCVMIVFLVLLPKGGSRLGGLPLTWGYLLLIFAALGALLIRLLWLPLRFDRRAVVITFFLIPFQALSLFAGHYYGISNLPFTFATFVGLAALPWIFLLVFPPFFPMLDGDRLARWFRTCVFLAAAWGIFLFFCKPLTGHFIEIPYLTVNASDYGELENTKNIARGTLFKLISTYNNGNLYGVSTLILLPLFLQLEPRRWRRGVVRVALLLTLSRGVWVGMIASELLSIALQLLRTVQHFPTLYLGAARRRLGTIAATLVFAVVAALFSHISVGLLQFFFDKTGGNRIGEVYAASGAGLLPDQALYGFAEILYASAAQYWGWSGLVAFTLIMLSPVILLLWDRSVLQSPIRRAALKGLMIYIVMAGIDGALDFIPVMAFYWFVYAVLLYGWPGGLRGGGYTGVAEAEHLPEPNPADALPGRSIGVADAPEAVPYRSPYVPGSAEALR